ncbi:forkhead domain-containing protein [Blastomyces dermatitidis ER-3]|uniref:Forkhead domain-containing protein n=2 Tax=Ajellomyces dermatitidis TaxID=5039 RepID=F2T6Z0_AJEDA|nr:forkhead domain-containing protein [Blastomyces dermatitidis ER-3]EEQ86600.2 forkhead domain-containing protein [Blastomyces dermatitidis ER-3]EGE79003.1 forkhead domain-containing protein [Blastomyces dermatitidis ATCC 18188]EQL37102.1 hypothetical protein BDFG_01399 [Blastomyces dermatitidis ATCC 26199]
MRNYSDYHHFEPRSPGAQYPLFETTPVYRTPPLEQSVSFTDTARPGDFVNSSSCSNSVSNYNDLSHLDPNFPRHPKPVQSPSALLQHPCPLAMAPSFTPDSNYTNYACNLDSRSYSLLVENTTTESPLTASRFSQNRAAAGSENFCQSPSYPELSPAYGENIPILPLQFHDEQQAPSRQQFTFSHLREPSMERLSPNLGATGFPWSPEPSRVSSPSERSSNVQFSPEATTASTGHNLSGGETDDEKSDEPYSKLIWRALQSVPDNKMALKEIYEWFEKNTKKARNSDSKGWQNSIRHNLSMNAAFEGVKDTSSPDGTPKKTANVWVLTKEALQNGVQSTTRYRKLGTHKKSSKSEHPAPQRQSSGAKGGKAAKRNAKMRRVNQEPHVEQTANRGVAGCYYQPRDDNIAIRNLHYPHQIFSDHSNGFASDSFGLQSVIDTHPDSGLGDNSSFSYPLFPESNEFNPVLTTHDGDLN